MTEPSAAASLRSGMVAALNWPASAQFLISLAKPLGFSARASCGWQAQCSAHRFLHERADPCLFGGGQLRQREGDRPRGAFVEVRRVAEAERRVPRVELLRALEEADDLAVLGIRGHPVPESRREGWRAGFDDRMEPLAHGAIRSRHLGDLREHGAFPVRLVRARAAARGRLQLLGALLHRASFLVRESLELLVDRGGALGGLLRVLHCRFPPLRVLMGTTLILGNRRGGGFSETARALPG